MGQTYNSQFRDKAAASAYPLDPQATQTTFPDALLLDLSVYVPSTYEPPFFILEASGGIVNDAVRFTIADARRLTIGHADCLLDRGSAVIMDEVGRSLGVLVYDSEFMEAFKGDIGGDTLVFAAAETPIQSECCRFYTPKGSLAVLADRYAITNKLRLSFAGGLTIEGDGSVNLYGEHESLKIPLRTVNGVEADHVFLLAHVHDNYDDESALRLLTLGNLIRIGKSRDF